MVNEEIVTTIELRDIMTGKLKQVTTSVENFGQTMQETITTTDKWTKKGRKATQMIKNTTREFGQFKFEMLGVLFFGMGISRFFKGLLKPALDVAGVFTILRDELAIFFLPAALEVQTAVLNLGQFLRDLPEPVQEAAGEIALLGIGIGAAVTQLGFFALGIDSINRAFPKLSGAIGKNAGKVGLFAGVLTSTLLIFSEWDELTTKNKVSISLLAGTVGVLAAVFGAPLLAAIGFITAALTALLTIVEALEEKFGFIERLFEKFPFLARGGLFGGGAEANFSSAAVGGPTTVPSTGEVNFSPVTSISVNVAGGEFDEIGLSEKIAAVFNELYATQVSSIANQDVSSSIG